MINIEGGKFAKISLLSNQVNIYELENDSEAEVLRVRIVLINQVKFEHLVLSNNKVNAIADTNKFEIDLVIISISNIATNENIGYISNNSLIMGKSFLVRSTFTNFTNILNNHFRIVNNRKSEILDLLMF